MSLVGPSRRFAATRQVGRFRRKTDIEWRTQPATSVENDPERTSRCSVRLTESEMEGMAGADAKRAARLSRVAISHIVRFASRERDCALT